MGPPTQIRREGDAGERGIASPADEHSAAFPDSKIGLRRTRFDLEGQHHFEGFKRCWVKLNSTAAGLEAAADAPLKRVHRCRHILHLCESQHTSHFKAPNSAQTHPARS